MKHKIKVAIICHFSNSEIQAKLPLRRPGKEFAPWIVSTLRELRKREDLEIHVISPHTHLVRNTSISEGNIQYHFFATGIPLWHRNWPGILPVDYYTNFWFNSRKIKKIVRRISPDIVHLYGAENAYFASAFLKLLHYPHLVTIQGFLYLVDSLEKNKMISKRIEVEKKIYTRAKNLGIRYNYMEEELKKLNPGAIFYWHHIPANIYVPEKIQKTYDIVYFAKLSKVKGIEDFIKVIGLVKKNIPEIKAKVLGSAPTEYVDFLKELAATNKCSENIEFKGFIPTQKEVHKIVSEAKICLLPVYFDTVPGTIVESLFLETAVVSYKTGGIPTLNEKEKTVELVEQGDISGLVNKILYLLKNEEERKELIQKAKNLSREIYGPEKAIADLANAYYEILESENTQNN